MPWGEIGYGVLWSVMVIRCVDDMLGMGDRHTTVERFSLMEHAQRRRSIHHKVLLEHQRQGRIFLPDNLSADASEWAIDDYYFLQPVPARQRRAMLREAGVARIDPAEREDCRSLRMSRGRCGCTCREVCRPPACPCCRSGIGCQVDQMAFPCSCSPTGCANPHGRVEFNAARVRGHFIRTLLQLGLEQNDAPPAKRCCLDTDQQSVSSLPHASSAPSPTFLMPGVSSSALFDSQTDTVYFDSVERLSGPETMTMACDVDYDDEVDEDSSENSSEADISGDDCDGTVVDPRQRTLDDYVVRSSRQHTYADPAMPSNCCNASPFDTSLNTSVNSSHGHRHVTTVSPVGTTHNVTSYYTLLGDNCCVPDAVSDDYSASRDSRHCSETHGYEREISPSDYGKDSCSMHHDTMDSCHTQLSHSCTYPHTSPPHYSDTKLNRCLPLESATSIWSRLESETEHTVDSVSVDGGCVSGNQFTQCDNHSCPSGVSVSDDVHGTTLSCSVSQQMTTLTDDDDDNDAEHGCSEDFVIPGDDTHCLVETASQRSKPVDCETDDDCKCSSSLSRTGSLSTSEHVTAADNDAGLPAEARRGCVEKGGGCAELGNRGNVSEQQDASGACQYLAAEPSQRLSRDSSSCQGSCRLSTELVSTAVPVCDDSEVLLEGSEVLDESNVLEDSKILLEDSEVVEDSKVLDESEVLEDSGVLKDSEVLDESEVLEDSKILLEDSELVEDSKVLDESEVLKDSRVLKDSEVLGESEVLEDSKILLEDSEVLDDCKQCIVVTVTQSPVSSVLSSHLNTSDTVHCTAVRCSTVTYSSQCTTVRCNTVVDDSATETQPSSVAPVTGQLVTEMSDTSCSVSHGTSTGELMSREMADSETSDTAAASAAGGSVNDGLVTDCHVQ